MTNHKFTGWLLGAVCLIAVGLLFARAAGATDQSRLIGKWVENFPSGAKIITEFTPTSIWSYGIDPSGKRTDETKRQDVTYRDVGEETIAIDFKSGGGITATMRDQQSVVLLFPRGAPLHFLVRMEPQ
jgi:hypothetical protein